MAIDGGAQAAAGRARGAPASARISLLAADPELAAGVPADDLPLARRVLGVPLIELGTGPWSPPRRDRLGRGAFALLVVDGLLTRETTVGARTSSGLVGPQDVIHPWAEEDERPPAMIEWRAGQPTRLAVLDERFLLAGRRWPSLIEQLYRRHALQAAREARHVTVLHVTPIEQRILAMLWHLARRWGRVSSAGVVLPLQLTHEALGRLVGAKRPTVTLALNALQEQGAIARRHDGVWVLREHPEAELPARSPRPPAAAAFASDPEVPARPAQPPILSPFEDLEAMRTVSAQLRAEMAARRRQVDETLVRARETAERSAETRRLVQAQREARMRRFQGPAGQRPSA